MDLVAWDPQCAAHRGTQRCVSLLRAVSRTGVRCCRPQLAMHCRWTSKLWLFFWRNITEGSLLKLCKQLDVWTPRTTLRTSVASPLLLTLFPAVEPDTTEVGFPFIHIYFYLSAKKKQGAWGVASPVSVSFDALKKNDFLKKQFFKLIQTWAFQKPSNTASNDLIQTLYLSIYLSRY